MPLTWNTVGLHTGTDTLPLADWNTAAVALNSMVGTWVSSGLVNNSSANGNPPFFAFFGYTSQTTSSGGAITLTIPNGGFPNGLVAALATIDSNANAQVGYHAQPVNNVSTKASVVFVCSNASGTALNAVGVDVHFLILGY